MLNEMEDAGFKLSLLSSPFWRQTLKGLDTYANVAIPVMADEAVYSPRDVADTIQQNVLDLINIKLMKTGGIKNALAI